MTARILSLVLALTAALPLPAARLKDLVNIEGVRDNQLIGYGLVVGLAGTGDRRQTLFSAQSLTNILERMGVAVSPAAIRINNTAAVLVTATLPPFAQPVPVSTSPPPPSATPAICRAGFSYSLRYGALMARSMLLPKVRS